MATTDKRRTRGEGSIYQRESDGRWIGVIDLGWVGGKRVRKTVSAPTLRELRPKFKRLQQQIDAGVLPDEMTVEGWMKHWLDTIAAEKVRDSTLRTYRGYVDHWIVPNLGKCRLDRLKPEHIRALYAKMRDEGKSDATRRQVHAILRRALSVAERENKIASNPAAKVDPPPVGTGSHGKLTLDEAKKILAVLDHPEVASPSRWVCALLAGIRQGEALGLVWDAVDLDVERILVSQAAQRVKGEGVKVVPLKSKAAYRAVPMVPPVAFALRREAGPEGFVWGSPTTPQDPRKDWQNWKDLLDIAEVPHRPLHAARATCGSLLLDAGVPDKIIAEILGHSNVKVTQDHYLRGDDRMHRDAMRRLNDLIALE